MNSFGPPAATVSHSEGTSNIFDSEVGSTTPRPVEQAESSQPPRREVRWVNLDANSQSLESIAHHFQDYIDCFLSSSSSTLRRIRALDDPSAFHTCPGYLREEITLTAEVSKSAIVSHAFADLGERCSFCGDLVNINVERDFGSSFARDETEGYRARVSTEASKWASLARRMSPGAHRCHLCSDTFTRADGLQSKSWEPSGSFIWC